MAQPHPGSRYESVILANFENVDTLVDVMDGTSGVAHVVCFQQWHNLIRVRAEADIRCLPIPTSR
jgi:hypothetical protein